MALAVPGGMPGGTNSMVKVGGVLLSFMAAQQLHDDITANEVFSTDETQHASPEEASTGAGESTELAETTGLFPSGLTASLPPRPRLFRLLGAGPSPPRGSCGLFRKILNARGDPAPISTYPTAPR